VVKSSGGGALHLNNAAIAVNGQPVNKEDINFGGMKRRSLIAFSPAVNEGKLIKSGNPKIREASRNVDGHHVFAASTKLHGACSFGLSQHYFIPQKA
jgi:hypothetical protein